MFLEFGWGQVHEGLSCVLGVCVCMMYWLVRIETVHSFGERGVWIGLYVWYGEVCLVSWCCG